MKPVRDCRPRTPAPRSKIVFRVILMRIRIFKFWSRFESTRIWFKIIFSYHPMNFDHKLAWYFLRCKNEKCLFFIFIEKFLFLIVYYILYLLKQGCGSAFILCGSGSSSFSECGSGSSLTKFEEKKSWIVFLSCKKHKRLLKSKKQWSLCKFTFKNFIKLQLLAISLHFFSF